jgi:hemerythrin HHE cation binding domain-containing protein
MNAYDVLFEHHKVLRGLCEKITGIAADTDERQDALDELLIELDIHMRIEDDLFYPAVSVATELVAIAHAEHRQVWDQLAVLLRTPRARRNTRTNGTRSSPSWTPTPPRRSVIYARPQSI